MKSITLIAFFPYIIPFRYKKPALKYHANEKRKGHVWKARTATAAKRVKEKSRAHLWFVLNPKSDRGIYYQVSTVLHML